MVSERLSAPRRFCSAVHRRRPGESVQAPSPAERRALWFAVVAPLERRRCVDELRYSPVPSTRRQQKERQRQIERDGHLISYFSSGVVRTKTRTCRGRNVALDSPTRGLVVNHFLCPINQPRSRCLPPR